MNITLQQIELYLETKQDNDVIGWTCASFDCLVAKALDYHYPGYLWSVGVTSIIGLPDMELDATLEITIFDLTEEIKELVNSFDALTPLMSPSPITKAEWRDAACLK